MTDHDRPTDEAPDHLEAAVDRHLTAAVRAARTATHPPERHAFLTAARIRRDRRRRRRRTLTITAPIVAAGLIAVMVTVVAVGKGQPSFQADRAATGQAAQVGASPSGAAVSESSPIRVTPDHGLVDGQSVQVTAYAAIHATITQCAVVQTPDEQRYYACTHDPAAHDWKVQGTVPPGSADDVPIAHGTLEVREQLRGRLYLLSYPDGRQTGLTSPNSDLSCSAEAIPTVHPEPTGTLTDTTAPATSDAARPKGSEATPPGWSRCGVMVTGLFFQVGGKPLFAPITFGGTASPASGAAKSEVTVTGSWAAVRITASDDTFSVRTRPVDSTTWGEPIDADPPNPSDAWVDRPIGLDKATIHVVMLPASSKIVNARDVSELALGTVACGRFTCSVYEVPRDRTGPALGLEISSRRQISSVPLDLVPANGDGILRGHFGG